MRPRAGSGHAGAVGILRRQVWGCAGVTVLPSGEVLVVGGERFGFSASTCCFPPSLLPQGSPVPPGWGHALGWGQQLGRGDTSRGQDGPLHLRTQVGDHILDLGMVSKVEEHVLDLGRCLGMVPWSWGRTLGQRTVSQSWGQHLGRAWDRSMGSLVGDNVLDLGTCLGLGDGILGQGMGSGT